MCQLSRGVGLALRRFRERQTGHNRAQYAAQSVESGGACGGYRRVGAFQKDVVQVEPLVVEAQRAARLPVHDAEVVFRIRLPAYGIPKQRYQVW